MKSELDTLRCRIGEDERLRIIAEERLKEIQDTWESQEGMYKRELEQVQSNLKELDNLNNSLQDQLVALTTQISSLRQAEGGSSSALNQSLNRSGESLDTSFSSSFMDQQQSDQSDQERKTSDQWMQVKS